MFVQIHMLQSMPPANLNRDETGQPKKCLFGGVTRSRISSQCLKRNIRTSTYFQDAFGEALGRRTKYLPVLVAQALEQLGGIPEDEFEGIKKGLAAQFKKEAKGEEAEEETGEEEVAGDGLTPQLVFFNPLFAKKIAELLKAFRKDNPEAYKAFIGVKSKLSKDEAKKVIAGFVRDAFEARESVSIDVGLFGRMTTSDLVRDVEAACQVAHAISTHEALIESDYFTAMDDLKESFAKTQTEAKGAGFLGRGDTETFFTSAVYYKYFNIDGRALLDNVQRQDVEQVCRAIGVMVQAAALATPSGKQNSFAAHSAPELILVEVSDVRQPVSYANAFLKPVTGDDLMHESVAALSQYCGSVAAAFAPADTRRYLLAVGKAADVPFSLPVTKVGSLPALVTAVEEAVSPSLQAT
jgi:CRISPR system Cascade subunit CasC